MNQTADHALAEIKPTLLIIDDEVALTRSLQIALRDPEFHVEIAHNAQEGLSKANALRPSAILLDLRLPDCEDLKPLQRLNTMLPDSAVFMMSAHGDIKTAVEAVKQGAKDFITKPFDVTELKTQLSPYLSRPEPTKQGLIGQTSIMAKLVSDLALVAKSQARTVLLLGDSGTGKTAAANELHRQSELADKAFVEVNCAALPESLLESELFGVEKGAFTGANTSRAGLIDSADGGTLFLDEVGELTLALQAKLLSFLESQRYRPVGSTKEKQANVRVITATNRDLATAVEEGSFRADLYYRLNVMPLTLPSLAQRADDIPLLLAHFAKQYAGKSAPIVFQPATLQRLIDYSWPGNIRELKNLVERLSVLYSGVSIDTDKLPVEFGALAASQHVLTAGLSQGTGVHNEPCHDERLEAISSRLADEEKQVILHALEQSGGHKGNAAKLLNISRHALKRRLQKLGIEA
ncbi:sigma-54-dependent transcriptional regulator [Vibrio ponticus]|uniref:sigma-54-dependent transcriptional regulator n=1 Tax=Vibrio ponticus TaxID=265668 RepID=UPI001C85619F|nr:sigma-54 dependent transcriptional regulator [Vibrio ponticus]